MRRGVAFFGLAAAFALCLWREVGGDFVSAAHAPISKVALAGGIFTLAIAVLIRE